MEAADVHAWLMAGGNGGICDRFDAHVFASILSIGLCESSRRACPVPDTVGLDGDTLVEVAARIFPHASSLFGRLAGLAGPDCGEDEQCLRDLLRSCTTEGSKTEFWLADMMARRAMAPNHLWQDLGLRGRRELSWIMERHFEPIARRNTADMKWKKFLFRTICRDEGFRLCTVPVCDECDDFDACFGDESGESLLARVRRDTH
ncbi:nitrogen fixation protein NifQ [Gluconacetobacter azotocaptans]|uniref:nitrogen fixation protein NifQ n=1 Tax=Gluconacetobacter azotocaptans TaxID=142834 RepID=UPI0019598A93|nr:nitrogen fixation protein NifQ [Gluconacetobacter azotocaptans]MBM9400562.1 nitrogen fixation protein NifQ [Gluconacetobacter azotocaptans]